MPTERIELPCLTAPIEAELVYLQTTKVRGKVIYLHDIKQNGKHYENTDVAEAYWLEQNTNMTALTSEVENNRHDDFTFLVAPPSDAAHLYAPYRVHLKTRYRCAEDISADFDRKPGVKAGTTRSTRALLDALRFDSPEILPDAEIIDVLFVDDVYAGGHTAAAIFHKLQEWLVGKTTRMTLACPLRAVPDAGSRIDYHSLAFGV
jgi:hypothetical protein